MARVGINGFGRMGRLGLRVAWGWPDLDIAHVNEIKGGPEVAAHLLKFDSIQGRWGPEVRAERQRIVIDGRPLSFSAAPTPGDIPWREQGVEIVLECSGAFRTTEALEGHFRGLRRAERAGAFQNDLD